MNKNSYTINALVFLLLVTIFSCSSPIEETENEYTAPEQIEVIDYTPISIVGKTISLGSNERYYNFTSSGSCSVYYSVSDEMYGTPQYNYSRTSNTQARFWAQFVDKNTVYESITKTTTVYYKTYTVDYTFTFTGNSQGSYSGTFTTYTPSTGSGVFVIPAKKRTRPSNGTFSLY